MSKGRYVNNKKSGKKWILLVVLLVILVGLIIFVVTGGIGKDADVPTETQGVNEPAEDAAASGSEASETAAPAVEATQEQETTDAATEAAATEAPNPAQTEAPEKSTEAPASVVSTEPPPVQIIQRADAEYEKWLAATMLVCVSMEYPDFQLEGIYAASSTALEDAMDSKGAYIFFTSGGLQLAFHSMPLAEERTEAGTKDISSQTLGFATYDLVSASAVDTASLTEIKVDDLGELISQSVLVSIYQH